MASKMAGGRKADGISAIAAVALMGTAGLAGCALIENGNGEKAFRQAYENSFYDPAYESIFSDPPQEFEPYGGGVGDRGDPGMNGPGEPAPYPDSFGE